jgi:hypothetical protein
MRRLFALVRARARNREAIVGRLDISRLDQIDVPDFGFPLR